LQDFALFGTIEVDDKDLSQIKSCMNELIANMKKDADKLRKK
ncbi:MAG: hypothetical protein RL063_432, partial [Pseudomonadota bacterium]